MEKDLPKSYAPSNGGSKKRKKEKKAKKHKKSEKKKHKKHKSKRHDSSDGESVLSGDGTPEPAPIAAAPVLASKTTTLNEKFTNMKTTTTENGNNREKVPEKFIGSKRKSSNDVPTDPKELVALITASLDPKMAPSMEIVSSGSESDV